MLETGRGLGVVVIAALLAACASVPQEAGYTAVDLSIQERLGSDPRTREVGGAYAGGTHVSPAEPLDVERALQLAMSNNRALRAAFEEVGVARGDLVAAGVLPNPNFEGSVRWTEDVSSTNPEIALTWDIMEVVRRSKRKNVARAELDRAAYDVSDRTLAFAAEVRTSFYSLQAAEQVGRMHVEVYRAAKAAAELARRRHAAGNINDLESAVEASVYQTARLDLIQSQAAVRVARTSLAAFLGLDAADTTWSVVAELPELPATDPPLGTLESLALARRFDLMAARKDIEAEMRDISYHKSYRIPSLEVGVDAERDFDGAWAYGPLVEMAIPLFDRGQGGVDRAQAELRRAEHTAAAVETAVRNDVSLASERLRAARDIAEIYRDDVIPTREKVVAESQRHYNFMLVGPMALLQAKRDEIEAYQKYIEAVRDYWSARAELERAVAGPLEVDE